MISYCAGRSSIGSQQHTHKGYRRQRDIKIACLAILVHISRGSPGFVEVQHSAAPRRLAVAVPEVEGAGREGLAVWEPEVVGSWSTRGSSHPTSHHTPLPVHKLLSVFGIGLLSAVLIIPVAWLVN